MSRLFLAVALALLPIAAAFQAAGPMLRRPMQQQPAISAVMPVDVVEPVLSATTLLAGLKSPADVAVANIMYLLGGPLVWAASLAFVISVLIQGDGRNADGSYR